MTAVRATVDKFGDGSQLTEPFKPKLDSCMSVRLGACVAAADPSAAQPPGA